MHVKTISPQVDELMRQEVKNLKLAVDREKGKKKKKGKKGGKKVKSRSALNSCGCGVWIVWMVMVRYGVNPSHMIRHICMVGMKNYTFRR